MFGKNDNMTQNSKENTEKLYKKIKQTWSSLSDSDIELYDRNRNSFFVKLKEKTNVSKEDAQKKLQQIEQDCGCSSAEKVA